MTGLRVELLAGHIYTIDLEGAQTEMGTLSDPVIRGIFNSDGERIPWTINDDGGEGYNSLVTFTPEKSGMYFISAGSYGNSFG